MNIDLVVWDFDGVLNAESKRDPFGWVARLDRDLGLSPRAFRALLDQPGIGRRVLKGEIHLRDVLADWLTTQKTEVTAEALLAHWLASEDRRDPQVTDWLIRSPQRAVIGTNNPVPRAEYIMQTVGLDAHVERIFASGAMGAAKPDAGFFAQIEHWAALVPSNILLIDDNRDNIAAAAKRGWQVFYFAEHTRDQLPARLGITP